MKREILYKAKTRSGKWVKGEPHVATSTRPHMHTNNGKQEVIIPSTLCQYAGREDKYDEQIFEGDKLKGGWVVVWEDCCFWAKKSSGTYEMERYPLSEFRKEELEVVGSIYDDGENAPGEPVDGDVCIFWNDVMRSRAVIAVKEKYDSDKAMYLANNGKYYTSCVKFKDMDQYGRILNGEI